MERGGDRYRCGDGDGDGDRCADTDRDMGKGLAIGKEIGTGTGMGMWIGTAMLVGRGDRDRCTYLKNDMAENGDRCIYGDTCTRMDISTGNGERHRYWLGKRDRYRYGG